MALRFFQAAETQLDIAERNCLVTVTGNGAILRQLRTLALLLRLIISCFRESRVCQSTVTATKALVV